MSLPIDISAIFWLNMQKRAFSSKKKPERFPVVAHFPTLHRIGHFVSIVSQRTAKKRTKSSRRRCGNLFKLPYIERNKR